MNSVVLDTDVASLIFKGELPDSMAAQLVGHRPCLAFVTLGELANDMWIAAACLVYDVPLATLNVKDFACCSRAVRSSVYAMRMARVNITVPDDLLGRAKAAGLNVSRLAAAALAAELERRAKVAELDAYLADLDAELGPIPQQESVAAREWADQVLPASSGGVDAAHTA